MALPQSLHNRSLVSRPPRAKGSDSRIRQPHGIAEAAGRLVGEVVRGSREENSWRLSILVMVRHGVRTKIYKALLLSVRGTKSINHHQVALEEWAKGVVEGGPAVKMGSELQVC